MLLVCHCVPLRDNTNKQNNIYTMKKNIGILLIALGAVLQILSALVPAMGDMADQNIYTWGSLALIIIGLLTHIFINKKLEA